MNIAFPVSTPDIESAELCPLEDALAYALVEVDENATIVEINFCEDKKEACENSDVFIITREDKDEDFLFEHSFKALIAPADYSIDEVIEGYQFRELHEVV